MRSTSISYASWILLSLALSSTVHAQNYTLLHRFIPLRPDSNSPWVEYGTIQLTPTDQTSVIGGNALRGEFVVNANGRDAQSNDGRGWYQVGLVVDDYTFTSSIRSVSCPTLTPSSSLSIPDHCIPIAKSFPTHLLRVYPIERPKSTRSTNISMGIGLMSSVTPPLHRYIASTSLCLALQQKRNLRGYI